jgi:glyoxylase-like metal-dependent hydrolase (beta-lactamase superfamily II)
MVYCCDVEKLGKTYSNYHLNEGVSIVLRKIVLVVVLLLMPYTVQALKVDNVEFDVNKLNENVYLLAQPYGKTNINFGVIIGDDSAVLISSMMLDYAPTIERLVSALTDKKIKYVINIDSDTYHHNANEYFSSKGATIISQRNIKKVNEFVDITYEESLTLDIGTELLELVHTSARSPGDSAIYLKKSNVVFLGDSYRNDWLTYTNESGYKAHSAALKRVLERGDKDTKYVPGNRASIAYSGAQGVGEAIALQLEFANTVRRLLVEGFSVSDMMKHREIRKLIEGLERYTEFKDGIADHINGVINTI